MTRVQPVGAGAEDDRACAPPRGLASGDLLAARGAARVASARAAELRLLMAMLPDAAALLAGERVGQHRAVEGQRLWIEAATLDR